MSANLAGQSAILLKEGTSRSQGREAQHANLAAALIIAGMILKIDDVIMASKSKERGGGPPKGLEESAKEEGEGEF